MTRVALALLCSLGLSACSWSTGGRGEACTRSTECDQGLACIESECSDDLSAIEDPGSVPMLAQDAGAAGAEPDAASAEPDAATSGDAGSAADAATSGDAG